MYSTKQYLYKRTIITKLNPQEFPCHNKSINTEKRKEKKKIEKRRTTRRDKE